MSDFPVPDAVLAHHTALLGKTGSGKTSTGKLLVEHVADEGFRVCILDTVKSDWWGMISSADGTQSGLSFRILGGPHGHVPLPSSAGAAIGRLVGSGKLPLSIIDMADFEMGGVQRFFVDFAEALMRSQKGVLYLVIEEAHEIAPKERAGIGGENLAVHWAKKLATAGRSKGIRLIVATQRVQSLHNAVLGSCETLVAHRLTTPADQKPVIDWVKANVPDKDVQREVAESLSSLPTGSAWVCSGEAQLFERVAFPKFRSFDNAATPTADDEEVSIKTATVDQDELRSIIGDAVAEAEANDPKLLKARIAELEKRGGGMAAPTWPDQRGEVLSLRTANVALEQALKRASAALGKVDEAVQAAHLELKEMPIDIDIAPAKREAPARPLPSLPQPDRLKALEQRNGTSVGSVPSGCAKPLAALAGAYPAGLSESQWAMIAGYKKTGGTWNEYRRRLQRAEMIEQSDGRWFATELGARAAGPVELPPAPGPELVRWWAPKINAPSHVVEALIEAWPSGYTRPELAERIGMAASGGSFQEYVRRLLRNQIAEEIDGGVVRLTDGVMAA